MNYIQIIIPVADTVQGEVLVAELAELGFESFEEGDKELLAYIQEDVFEIDALREVLDDHEVSFSMHTIAQQNWNEAWEKSFDPVIVGDFCAVRADFHEAIPDVAYDIVITPKMSFGTGHHDTTRLMIEQMSELDMKNKTVLDFGTGTGVLAILAELLGAKEIMAIDTDEWSYENTLENVQSNKVHKIYVKKGSLEVVAGEQYDIILANINRHILLAYMSDMQQALNPGGQVLMSGILPEDEELVTQEAEKVGLKKQSMTASDKWICIRFSV